MFASIPRNLLPHKITLKSDVTLDARGNKTYGKETDISFVRVEEVRLNALTAIGEQADDKLKLFVDCKNSYPLETYEKGDTVEYKEKEYTIRHVEPKDTTSTEPHHLEIYLK